MTGLTWSVRVVLLLVLLACALVVLAVVSAASIDSFRWASAQLRNRPNRREP